MNNIFQELQEKKLKMKGFLNKAEEFGWIDSAKKKEYLSKIEQDVLTIGVIGQMKSGKSTFLNAFVFEDDVLPAATTPMTAALSVITYGADKKIEAEFYSKEEWEEQKTTASMDLSDVSDDLMKSKIKAAKELVEKSDKLGQRLPSLLGTKKIDSFENLKEYVGADGTYVSITKAVNIFYPKEYLKGVNIVDTPGFNDPIVSREERTKEFLKKADAVLLMLYAGRPFDSTDRAILFKNVGDCGIGKVLIGINKYDIPYGNGESEKEIKDYVKEMISRASQETGDEQLNDLLKETEPIPVSAEMALLSEMPQDKVNSNETYSFDMNRYKKLFETTSTKEILAKSHISDLTEAVRNVINKEKSSILFRKPVNAVLAAANVERSKVLDDIAKTQNLINTLQMPDDELDEAESKLERVDRRMKKKISSLGADLDDTFNSIVRNGSEELENAVHSACIKMVQSVDNWGRFSNTEKLKRELKSQIKFLQLRTLKRIANSINYEAKGKLNDTMNDFFNDSEELLLRLPGADDMDVRDIVKRTSQKFNFETDDTIFSVADDEFSLDDFLYDITNILSIGLTGLINHGAKAAEFKEKINDFDTSFDGRKYLQNILNSKDDIIEEVEKSFEDELLEPLKEQLQNVKQQTMNKEQELEKAQERLAELSASKKKLAEQADEIGKLKAQLI